MNENNIINNIIINKAIYKYIHSKSSTTCIVSSY